MTMDIITRSAVVLRPKQPYLAWMRLDDKEGLADAVMETLTDEPCVYLVPDWEEDSERLEVIREFWPVLFEAMLEAWVTDPALWPADRTQSMFEEWFKLESYAMVGDLDQDEVIEHL